MNEELRVVITANIDGLKQNIKEAKNQISDFDKAGSKADAGLTKAFSSIKNAAKTVGKAIGSAMVAGGAAIVAMGKKALEQYSTFEQLEGGVSKLYKSAADDVMKYASQAYKTVGMTTNQYLETATAFSASLIDSLNGDVREAARLTDVAVNDMADNASVFGTSLESIENAYKGFAKQNYTMLDNLKLGYGGTKTEMERLLADAQKLTGVKYDINNFDDVISAIHAVQDNMKITGNAANEASKTIEGSLNATKAAYGNLLTGLMDENANIPELVGNLATSVGDLFENVKPKIKQFFQAIPEAIHQVLEPYPEVQAAVDSIIEVVSNIATTIGNVVTFVVQNWSVVAPILAAIAVAVGVISAAITVYNAVMAVKKVMDAAEVASLGALIAVKWADFAATMAVLAPYLLIAAAIAALIAIIVLCVKHWDQIKEKVKEVAAKIKEAVLNMVEKVKSFFQKIIDFVKNNWQGLLLLIVNPFAGAFKLAYDNCEGFRNKVDSFISKVKSVFTNGFNAVKNFVVNTFTAIKTAITSPIEKARDTVHGVVEKIKSFFKFTVTLPKIKLPHFAITPAGWQIGDLLKGKIPKLGIKWYATGGVFNKPTVFMGNTGGIGVGESGAEAIVPLEKNTKWLDKIAEKLGGRNNTPIYLSVDGKVFAETTINTLNDYTRKTGSLPLVIA